MRTTIAGAAAALAYFFSQILQDPVSSWSWPRAFAVAACVGGLVALGIFSRDGQQLPEVRP